MNPTLSEIAALAREVLAAGDHYHSTEDSPDAPGARAAAGEHVLVKLDEYVTLVGRWQEDPAPASAAQEPLLRELSENLHPRVLALAQALKEDTSRSMQVLRKKGRGLMAYADNLPKTVSVRRSQKG